jgi:hypothetical protein
VKGKAEAETNFSAMKLAVLAMLLNVELVQKPIPRIFLLEGSHSVGVI